MSTSISRSTNLPQSSLSWRLAAAYGLMLAATVVGFLAIRWWGERLPVSAATASVSTGTTAVAEPKVHVFPHVLLALASILVTCRLVGSVFVRIGQPRVIGEVVAGILLGPSFLGRIAPAMSEMILPTAVAPFLQVIAQLGVVLYMFLVGLHLNAELLRSRAHTTVAISHASIVAPFLLGSGLALFLFPHLAPSGVGFTSFALFMGVAMAITAFSVLARILTDRGIERTELGVIALSCAAADDMTAWCLLAFVVGVAQSELTGAVTTTLLAVSYLVFMLWVVKRFAHRFFMESPNTQYAMPWILVALLGSSLITEMIGIHAIFGAFLLGAVIPHDCAIAQTVRHKLEDVVTMLLLPAFFAYTGMRTQIGLVSGFGEWTVCAVIILVATLGKVGGSVVAARLTGLDWRMSASLGVLMNTRGLMELIVLNVGLDLGVISPTLFAMMVLMAIVTTMATSPLLQRLNPSLHRSPQPSGSS